ncbi:MAG: FIST N-terminal domain-containing protein [Candidatus Omnitrophota bacterium]|jgi:hypothetical protein|nr:FIST C-terminal domain-containing protein [Candidatus Omnitrophota bacterium]MDD5517820.1 FIST C-terminal domain-containing protein [Candidatus Omnitrophota bacterium]
MQAAIGISTAQDHLKAAKEAVEKAKQDLNGKKIKFAFVFSTGEFCHPLVLETIADLIGPVQLLGASSTAIICNQGSLKQGLMVILFSLEESIYFNAACVKDIGANTALTSGEELGERLLYGCKNVRRNLSVIFSNTSAVYNSNFITGLQEKLGRSFPLVGASITAHKESCLYFGPEILHNAACGILWGGKLNFNLEIGHGWQPLGKPRYVTRSLGDIVNEIDGVPAANLYKEYFAKEIPELKKELKRLSVFYPLGLRISENNDYLLRSIVSIESDGSLVFRGEVPQGSYVRLMISSKEACLLSASNVAKTTLRNVGGKKIKFAFILNSLSRNILLGRQAIQEIKLIRDILGEDVPLSGIYTSAEQAPLNSINYLGKTYFHNNSIALLTIVD